MTSFRDALVIYTDGLTEAQNLQDEYYGDARFAAAINAAPAGFVNPAVRQAKLSKPHRIWLGFGNPSRAG